MSDGDTHRINARDKMELLLTNSTDVLHTLKLSAIEKIIVFRLIGHLPMTFPSRIMDLQNFKTSKEIDAHLRNLFRFLRPCPWPRPVNWGLILRLRTAGYS